MYFEAYRVNRNVDPSQLVVETNDNVVSWPTKRESPKSHTTIFYYKSFDGVEGQSNGSMGQ